MTNTHKAGSEIIVQGRKLIVTKDSSVQALPNNCSRVVTYCRKTRGSKVQMVTQDTNGVRWGSPKYHELNW